MKKVIFFIFILSIIFIAPLCNLGSIFMHDGYVSPDYVIMAQQLRSDIATKLSKKYKMRVFGTTGGLADCVNLLGLDFQIQGPLSKDQLRKILIESVEEFLAEVNAHERLRPFLKNYPFTEKEIEIAIFVVGANGEEVYYPTIGIANASHGKLRYRTEEKANPYKYKTIEEEDYKTALKIVKEEQSKAESDSLSN